MNDPPGISSFHHEIYWVKKKKNKETEGTQRSRQCVLYARRPKSCTVPWSTTNVIITITSHNDSLNHIPTVLHVHGEQSHWILLNASPIHSISFTPAPKYVWGGRTSITDTLTAHLKLRLNGAIQIWYYYYYYYYIINLFHQQNAMRLCPVGPLRNTLMHLPTTAGRSNHIA